MTESHSIYLLLVINMSRKSIKTNKGVELSIIDYDDCLQTEMIAMKILNDEECSIIIESNGFNESNLNLYTTAIDELRVCLPWNRAGFA